jgi:hypothetical protein
MNCTAAIMAGRLITPPTNAHAFAIANACAISATNTGTSDENAPINQSKRRRKQPPGESARCFTSMVSTGLPPGPLHEPLAFTSHRALHTRAQHCLTSTFTDITMFLLPHLAQSVILMVTLFPFSVSIPTPVQFRGYSIANHYAPHPFPFQTGITFPHLVAQLSCRCVTTNIL